MKSFEDAEARKRKAYVKPQLAIVSLEPKQTVLGNCHSVSLTAPHDSTSCSDLAITCMAPS